MSRSSRSDHVLSNSSQQAPAAPPQQAATKATVKAPLPFRLAKPDRYLSLKRYLLHLYLESLIQSPHVADDKKPLVAQYLHGLKEPNSMKADDRSAKAEHDPASRRQKVDAKKRSPLSKMIRPEYQGLSRKREDEGDTNDARPQKRQRSAQQDIIQGQLHPRGRLLGEGSRTAHWLVRGIKN